MVHLQQRKPTRTDRSHGVARLNELSACSGVVRLKLSGICRRRHLKTDPLLLG